MAEGERIDPPSQRPTTGPFPTPPPPAGESGAFQPDAFQATPSQPVLKVTVPVTARVADGSAAGEATVQGVGEAVRRPGAEDDPTYSIKGSDLGMTLTSADSAGRVAVRVEVALRPVEVMLRDPLGEVARKERRSLLGISAIAILVGRTGLVPAKIENFGISFAAPERQALLWVFFAVVLYYTVAFIVYAMSDFLMYLYAVHQGREELRKQKQNQPAAIPATSIGPPTPQWIDTPWSFVRYVTPASLVRGVFDFLIPLVVAVVAMWSLWSAVHQVPMIAPSIPTAPSAPAPPAVTPAVPPGTAPSPKTR